MANKRCPRLQAGLEGTWHPPDEKTVLLLTLVTYYNAGLMIIL